MTESDQLNLRGEFTVRVYRGGELVQEWTDRNVIVNNGRDALARLLSGVTANKSVTKIGFGTGTGAAAQTNTSLTNMTSKSVGAITYPETGAVQFAWSLETSEGNGLTITEFGLLTADNTLFARKVRGGIAKTSDIRLDGYWKILF